MFTRSPAFARRIIATAAGSGIVLGALAGAMTPTTMREAPPEWWRGQIEQRKSPERISYRFVEYGPQGLPQPEIRALARHLAERTARRQPVYQPSGYEGFAVAPPAAMPTPPEVRELRQEPVTEPANLEPAKLEPVSAERVSN